MTTLLLVHHTVSPALDELREAAEQGVRDAARELDADLTVNAVPALRCGPHDVLAADAIVLGTPANLGSMSGALKHFFDTIYYPCLHDTVGRPYGCYIHGNNDTTGALTSITKIVTGLQWRAVTDPVEVTGPADAVVREQVWNLAATVAASAIEVNLAPDTPNAGDQ